MTTKTETPDEMIDRFKAGLASADARIAVRAEIKSVAEAEASAKKAAEKDGADIPATPILEWMGSADYKARRNADGRSTAQSSTRSGGGSSSAGLQYFHNGHAISASQNRLSSLAYYYTRRIDGDSPRVSTERFIEILKGLGVDDPKGQPFDVVLPNGARLHAAVGIGSTPAPAKAAAAKKADPTKRTPAPKPHAVSAPVAKGLTAASKAAAARKARPVTKAQQTRNNGKATAKKAS